MSKHTKGPYVVKALADADDMDMEGFPDGTLGVYAKSDLDNKEDCPSALCFMNTNWGEHKHTARLFAAAPALLEALEQIVKFYTKTVDEELRWTEHSNFSRITRAVIAQAKGRN